MMHLSEEDQGFNLSEFFSIIKRHKWAIIGSLFCTVTFTMFLTLSMKPVYQATATMIIDRQQSTSQLTGEKIDYENHGSESLTFNTHFELITSRPVLQNVIKELDLQSRPEDTILENNPIVQFFSDYKNNFLLLIGKKKKMLTAEEKFEQLLKIIHKKIEINQVMDTRLLEVNVADNDPEIARDMANSLAKNYINFDLNNRMISSQRTLKWLTDHLYEMKKRLEDAEQMFLTFKQKEKLISIEESQKVTAQRIMEFNDAYLKARNRRLELDAKLAQLKIISKSGKDIPNLSSLIENKFIDVLYSQMVNAELELSRLSKVYKSKHPKMVQARTKIENNRKKLNQEMKKELNNLGAERAVLLDREKVLKQTMEDFEKEARDINTKELRYNILKRDLETNQNLYDTLLSRLKETNITGNVNFSNLRITEEAVNSKIPIRPKKKLNLLLSIIFGLLLGISIGFLDEYMDRTLRTEEDVQKYLNLPVLSVIPVADKAEQV